MTANPTRYSQRQRSEAYADAVARFLTRQGIPASVRYNESLDLWLVDHDKRISKSLQMLLTGFLDGLEEALFDVE